MTKKEYIEKKCEKDKMYLTAKGLAAGFITLSVLITYLLWVCVGFNAFAKSDIIVIFGFGMVGGIFAIICDLTKLKYEAEYEDHEDYKKLTELRNKNNIR